ncbi:LOW QUALITY PROTEIN: Annexin domain-containing protein, partial [Cephalotus follicularis]
MWTIDPPERDAQLARDALKSKKKIKDLQVIVEIACASSPRHLMAVRQAYCSLFDNSLEEEIACTIALPLQKLVHTYIWGLRGLAIFNLSAILLLHSFCLVSLLVDELYIKYSPGFVYKFRNELLYLVGEVKVLVLYCLNHQQVIRNSIVGLGTDEDSLTRAIVTRAEIDTMKIRGEYFNMYKTNLDGAVSGDTSGDYKYFLMTLLGARM